MPDGYSEEGSFCEGKGKGQAAGCWVMALSRNEVTARLAQVNIKDRSAPVVRPSPEGMRDALWVNFYNVPPACTRLDHDLHRVLLVLRGFDKTDPDLPVLELRLHFVLAAFPFDRAFPDKEGKAEDILAFLTEFLEVIARDFKPWIPRHRRPESLVTPPKRRGRVEIKGDMTRRK